MLLSAENISMNYGTKQLLNEASIYLNDHEKIGIIGVNGTGKSTLLKILAGTEHADSGTVTLSHNTHISYLPQNPQMDDNNTVIRQVMLNVKQSAEYEAKSMLSKLGINDFDAKIGTLSGGQKKRCALAGALIAPAEILILDEPTNHLDSDMVIWLENRLKSYTGGIIMVTHDRYFLERVVTSITELSRGKLFTYEANYSKYLELKTERSEMEKASERKRQSILRTEYQWIMRGAIARGTKSRERTQRYYDLKAQDSPVDEDSVSLVTMSSRLGKKLIEISDVSKAYDTKQIISHFSYNLKRDDRIGIIGRNGIGKTTLMNLMVGKIPYDEGDIKVGATASIGYFSQESKELDPDARVYDFINDIAREVVTAEGTFSASQMLERFLFDGDLQYQTIGKLSGGERRRLYLLSILITAPNILLLDEPTNDLDITTLSILEDYIQSFSGAVIVVSHDRFFLDKVVTSIFEINDGGSVEIYNGNFSEYLEKRTCEITEKATAKKEKPAYKNQNKTQKLKFSFKEQREYDTIDDDIAALEEEISECEKLIAVTTTDYVRLCELTENLENMKKNLNDKTDRWVYLNDLAERIEQQEKDKQNN